jgi:hypothetical protein
VTDYDKLVKALRCKHDDCEGCDLAFFDNDEGWMCQYAAKDDDAADAIEAMQAQMPKRGKWVGVSPMVDTVQCSVCGGQLFSAELETPYCPYCGAKMEVQDESVF